MQDIRNHEDRVRQSKRDYLWQFANNYVEFRDIKKEVWRSKARDVVGRAPLARNFIETDCNIIIF